MWYQYGRTMATHTTPPAGDPGEGPPPEVIEDLLADERCRTLLEHLHEAGRPVPVGDLAALLADGDDATASRAERRAARTEIYQDCLPRLTATGAVRFDSLLGTVAFAGGRELVARLTADDGAA